MEEPTELDLLYQKAQNLQNDIAFLEINIQTNVVSVNGVNIWDLKREKEAELYDINMKLSKLE